MPTIMKSFFKFSFLFFLSNLGTVSWGQEFKKPDSLLTAYKAQADDSIKVKTLHELFNSYIYNDPIVARAYAHKQLTLAQQIGYKKGVAQAYYDIGVYHNNRDQVDSTRIYYQKAVKIFEAMQLQFGIAMVNYGLAILEFEHGNYSKALEMVNENIEIQKNTDSLKLAMAYGLKGRIFAQQGYYRIALTESLKGLKILEKIDNPIRLADALNILGSIEAYNKNFEKSLEYNFRALKIYEEKDDRMYQAQALNDIGNDYFYMKEYKKARQYLTRSVSLAEEMNNTDLQATTLNNLGKVYRETGLFEKAIEAHKTSLKMVEKTRSNNKIVESLNDLGQTYNAMDKARFGIGYFNKAIQIADSIPSLGGLLEGYQNRALSFAEMGDYKAAFHDMQQYVVLKDTVFNITKSQQIEELKTIYETEKKEQQIAQQTTDIALLEEKEKVSSLQKWSLGAGLGLSFLVFGFGFYGIRQKMKRTALEKEKVEAELAFKRKELTTHALHLAKKNETLENLKMKAEELKVQEASTNGYQQLITSINFDLQDDNNWENFARYFEEVHKDFNSNVARKYPEITSNELRLMALLKMNLSSKEIANILNISIPGIKKARQRLRKKMNLSTSDSLENAVLAI